MKTNETLTRYIKNWADSAKFKECSSHLTLCGLIGNRSEMPNFSYTHPLAEIANSSIEMFPDKEIIRTFVKNEK
jgi:hypothetical protein